jgi:hypothetical protein
MVEPDGRHDRVLVSTINTKPARDETSAMAPRFLALLSGRALHMIIR